VALFVVTTAAVGACSSSSTNVAGTGGAAGASTGGSSTGGSNTGGSNTGGGATGGTSGASGAAGTPAGGAAGSGATDAGFQCPTGKKGPKLVNAGIFCIDATEVSNENYDAFLKDSSNLPTPPAACTGDTHDPYTDGSCPTFALSTEPKLPVVCVDWCDAQAYCAWAGKRLCGSLETGFGTPLASKNDATVSEWYAACVGNPAQPDKYFYGGGDTGQCVGANIGSVKHVGETTACQSFWLKGLFDMSGNVAEWEDGCDNVTGSSANCLVRGGSFNSASADLACDASQEAQRGSYAADRGFRCCWDPTVN
jgi:formylglycine-generating enzyme required for sulfatase activity